MNQAKCRLCKQIITSTHRHDFVTCKCGAISVDGGNDYQKLTGNPYNFLFKKKGKWVVRKDIDKIPIPVTSDNLLKGAEEFAKKVHDNFTRIKDLEIALMSITERIRKLEYFVLGYERSNNERYKRSGEVLK